MRTQDLLTEISGVFANGIAAGIKAKGSKDLAFIYVPDACASAGVFTKNAFAAACVEHNRNCLETNTIKAILINSGNANAATGELGRKNCSEMAALAAESLGLAASEVAVASTGIIGKQLPMDVIARGIATLLAQPEARKGGDAAEAIMTTDLVSKEVLLREEIHGATASIAGIAKGSGMIAPNMATMLGFLVCDVQIDSAPLKEMFLRAVERSFNMISVDTDTSTNDMVLCIANGSSGIRIEDEASCATFESMLTSACIELAKKIVRDGEGASKCIEAVVTGADSTQDAKKIAKSIIDSPLVKTAIHGGDPNWGRLVMAVGKTTEARVVPNKVTCSFQAVPVFQYGQPLSFDIEKLRDLLSEKEIVIHVDLGLGAGSATAWGCDLTKSYIDINVDYN